jgi:vancomycin permeability regulator SanA
MGMGVAARRLLLLGIILAVVWVGYMQWRMAAIGRGVTPEPADVGIVLGAALWNNVPSPGLKERLDQALQLYRDGKVSVLIVSGGYDYNGSEFTEAEGMGNYLLAQGVPSKAIFLEKRATNTYQNLLYSEQIMQKNGWSRAIIITHRYHSVRALDIARYLKMEQPQVAPTDTQVMSIPWNRFRETLALVKWEAEKALLTVGMSFPSNR